MQKVNNLRIHVYLQKSKKDNYQTGMMYNVQGEVCINIRFVYTLVAVCDIKSIPLPGNVDVNKAKSTLKNWMLWIEIPKKGNGVSRCKEITIKKLLLEF